MNTIINELNPTEPDTGINALIDESKKPPQMKPMNVIVGERVEMKDGNGNAVVVKGFQKS